jgi:glycolate oxidase iron-sulfur subunit
MQTNLAGFVQNRPEARELESILRDCVHCGFCLATCPTYQLLGNELDSPRGRIYLLKQVLEGEQVSRLTQQHLDRCLTCRACETTCPSGVRYGRLLDIGRDIVESKVSRPWLAQAKRWLIRTLFPYPKRFSRVMQIARGVRPILPSVLKQKIPLFQQEISWPEPRHQRKVLLLSGCVQPALAPSIDVMAAKVLDNIGISLIKVHPGGCCGALNYHLSDHQQALAFARQNIDACWPYIEQGAEAVLMTASGCGVMIKSYGELLQFDPEYAAKAARVSALTKDISEILQHENLSIFSGEHSQNVAFHAPCTLQHGQQIIGVVEMILYQAGYHLTEVADAHICCGSAGVYSLLQPKLSAQLLNNKVAALQAEEPDIIATANIGCLTHLQSKSNRKVVHWVELLM